MGLVLSYSRKDSQFADQLYKLLELEGYDVWIDRRDINIGAPWDTSIQAAIDKRSQLAVILSLNSVESENVSDEWSYALDQGKTVIPIYYQECNVPMRLRRLQRIDFHSGKFMDTYAELTAFLGAPDRSPNDRSTKKSTDDSLPNYKPDPSDVRLLNEMWEYLKTPRIRAMCEDIINGWLDGDEVAALGDIYLVTRNNPEDHLYDKKLDDLLHEFDIALQTLFDYTGTYFYPMGGDKLRLKYPIDPEMKVYNPREYKLEDYKKYQQEYAKMVQAAHNVFEKHNQFLQELRNKRLIPRNSFEEQ